jgi:hypothetical protein
MARFAKRSAKVTAQVSLAVLGVMAVFAVPHDADAAPRRKAAPKAPVAVAPPPPPVDPYAPDRAKINEWRTRLLSSSFTPDRNLAIMSDGSSAGALQKGCDKDTPAGTVALEVRAKRGKGRPGENHSIIGYRGDSGAWCMASGVGIITFADGARWLGQVSTQGEGPTGRNFLPRPDGLGEMIAADGGREARKVVARADILWGYDLIEALPAAPGGAVASPSPVVTTKAAPPAPAPAPVKVAATAPPPAPKPSEAAPPAPAKVETVKPQPSVGLAGLGLAGLMASGKPAPAARPASAAAPVGLALFAAAAPAQRSASVAAPAASPAAAAPTASGLIEGVTGLYMSPFTSDGVTAGWITKSLQVKAAGQIGSMAGNYLGQKAMENVPFVGGFLGKKAGEAMGRQMALSAIGGEAFLKESSDLSFNTPQTLVNWTMANYGAREDINQVMQAVIAIYPDVQTPYLVAAQRMARERKGAGPGRTGAPF